MPTFQNDALELTYLDEGPRDGTPVLLIHGFASNHAINWVGPGWVKTHRDKLGLSAADYGKLVGVSGLTIYNWEKGESSPREKQLLAWGEIRGLGKREAVKRLELIED